MIQVKKLVKKYGGHVAVDDLTFTVEQGKIYGFLGPNGAGKTTTMNVMTGYIAANGGTVIIDGHDILKEPLKAKACIGYLPEVPPLYPDMTVREFLLFAAELKKLPKTERKKQVRELIRKWDRKHAKYYEYYTGRRWGGVENYDLCINSASYGIDGSVELIRRMIKKT